MRPEANYSDDEREPADWNRDAWQEFTPWRPGDPSPTEGAPSHVASEFFVDGRRWAGADQAGADRAGRAGQHQADKPEKPDTRWWTEKSTRPYERGDAVRSTGHVGGDFISTVPPGTKGEVLGRELGVLGAQYVEVRFANGYTAKVQPDQLERRSWWD